MAKSAVFFWVETGTIYGTHPNTDIKVPEGVDFIEVEGLPNEIAWPALPDGRKGTEQTSRVNPETRALEVGTVPPPDPDEALTEAIRGATDLNELKAALLGEARPGQAGRVAARG